MRRLLVSGSRETVGRSSISMIGNWGLRGYEGEARGLWKRERDSRHLLQLGWGDYETDANEGSIA